jgi:hypothetical protein
MSRGRPFEPGNNFGRGRPKGSPNKKVRQARELLEQHAPAITAMAIKSSREDTETLRWLVSRILSRPRELPVKIGRLPMSTLADLERASAVLIQMATAGKISLSEAREVANLVEQNCRVMMQDWERRIRILQRAGNLADEVPTSLRFSGTLEELLEQYRQVLERAAKEGNEDEREAT